MQTASCLFVASALPAAPLLSSSPRLDRDAGRPVRLTPCRDHVSHWGNTHCSIGYLFSWALSRSNATKPRLALLRGDLFQRVSHESESCYLLAGRVQLHHRPGQHQGLHVPSPRLNSDDSRLTPRDLSSFP